MTKDELKKQFLTPRKMLKRERASADISKREMAKVIGVGPDAYTDKENGKYPFADYEMAAIAKKLKLPIEYLFFID